jgi:two-component system sensor histidine kinase KdpD
MRVADDGPGLPPGSEERIFDKFYRGSAGSADARRGVGLGLAICHAIVAAHGGKIAARNRPAGGAEFIVSLSSERPPEVPAEAPAGGGRALGE